jgi:hypothetical protein
MSASDVAACFIGAFLGPVAIRGQTMTEYVMIVAAIPLMFARAAPSAGGARAQYRRRGNAGSRCYEIISIRALPEGTQNAELKQEALRLGRELLRGTKYVET